SAFDVHGTGEARHRGLATAGLLAHDVDPVDADAPAALHFDRARDQRVAGTDRRLVRDVGGDARGDRSVRVRGQAERRVGEGEERTAVTAAVEVEVPRVDGHGDLGSPRGAGAKGDAERAAEAV